MNVVERRDQLRFKILGVSFKGLVLSKLFLCFFLKIREVYRRDWKECKSWKIGRRIVNFLYMIQVVLL